MTIYLPKNIENSIEAAVQSGQFISEGDLIIQAVRSFLQQHGYQAEAIAERTTVYRKNEETAFDVMNRAGLIGCIKSRPQTPTDLSINPMHMAGFGSD